jgi:hypothetical protein
MNLAQQKLLVSQFLERCNAYAADKIAGYRTDLTTADATPAAALEREALQQKIDQWTTYRDFNEHAIGELASGELDAWFETFERG